MGLASISNVSVDLISSKLFISIKIIFELENVEGKLLTQPVLWKLTSFENECNKSLLFGNNSEE